MYKKLTKVLLFVFLLALAGVTSACLKSPLFSEAPLTVLGTLEGDSESMSDVVEALIIVSRNKHVVEETVPVHLNEFQATLYLPVGQWELTVLLLDSDGMVRYQSKPQETQISLDESTIVELSLQPAASSITISIDLENYIFKEEALRARIHFDDEIYEVIRSDSSEPFETTIQLTPGSYEFKIELYTESFRVGDRLGFGAWEIVHVGENEEITITWTPQTEALQISGRVETLLPPPEDVTISANDETVIITWQPVIHFDQAGYLVFAQTSPLDRFQLLNPTPLEEPYFVHELEMDPLPAKIIYVVAAVSRSGLVGYYSEQQFWTP